MADKTGIGWTGSTHNEVIGCAEKSDACAPCYARELTKLWYGMAWGKQALRFRTSEGNRRKPFRWNQLAAATGEFWPVFAFSLADWAEVWVDQRSDAQITADMDRAEASARAWRDPKTGRPMSERAIENARNRYARADFLGWIDHFLRNTVEPTTALTWQLLTKRAEQVLCRIPHAWRLGGWPQHAWLGLTCESQRWAALRLVWGLQAQRQAGIPIVFCSAEPLYRDRAGSLDFERLPILTTDEVARMLRAEYTAAEAAIFAEEYDQIARQMIGSGGTWNAMEAGVVGWVITGGQSGGNSRRWLVDPATGELKPEALADLRHLRDQCSRYAVPFFHKQHGGRASKSNGKVLDGQEWCQFPGGRQLGARVSEAVAA